MFFIFYFFFFMKYQISATEYEPIRNLKSLKIVSKKGIQKTAETTGDLFSNKIADKVSRRSSQNSSGRNDSNLLII